MCAHGASQHRAAVLVIIAALPISHGLVQQANLVRTGLNLQLKLSGWANGTTSIWCKYFLVCFSHFEALANSPASTQSFLLGKGLVREIINKTKVLANNYFKIIPIGKIQSLLFALKP